MIKPTRPGVFRMPRPADNFTMISHEFSRSQLSARAVKVGLYILSHAEGFTETQDRIARVIKLSPKTVRAALEDLEEGGFLVRYEIREGGHRVGTAYGITDQVQRLTGDFPGGDFPGGDFPGHKKTSSSKKISNPKKTNPSGGSSADAAGPTLEPSPTHDEEEPVTTSVDQGALFDVPEKKKTAGTSGRKAADPSAGTVVAAFVDSYRAHHSGADPLKRDIGRVARESKAILVKGEAGPQELTDAAREMGQGPYSNIAMALKIHRDRGARSGNRKSGVPARPYTDPDWVKVAQDEDRAWYEELMTDDDAIRWARRSADEVQALIARYGEPLAARFEAVA